MVSGPPPYQPGYVLNAMWSGILFSFLRPAWLLAATVMREGSVSFTNLFSSVNSASMSTPLEEASGWWPISLKMPHMQMEGWFQCW